jgi:hypothetical protein
MNKVDLKQYVNNYSDVVKPAVEVYDIDDEVEEIPAHLRSEL